AATDRGSEVMAFVAAIADLPLAANCTDVAPGPDGQPWSVRRLRWAGSIQEVAELSGDGPKLLTVTPNAVSAEPADTRAAAGSPAPGSPAEVRAVAFHPDQADLAVRVSQRVEPTSDGVSLADARVVVGGGRGVGGEEGFAVLEELAGLLGGTVGVSRAVTSLGWRPHRDQVGQTGTRITPELYIACGISGAIQHMVGCKAARHILAINSDPDAPIMAKADYTVAGDLHAVLPAVVAEVRKARGEG
ncbi:MAG: electron transfer flavoprotein subunit alpha/FixB family protein, partial [Acidimicrobiales bacterium]